MTSEEKNLLLAIEVEARKSDDNARRRAEASRFTRLLVDLDIIRAREQAE